MGRIKSERENKYQYKGNVPLKFDRFTLWFFKTIFQIPIFILLYIAIIGRLTYNDIYYGLFMTILWVFIILFISDLVAQVLAWWVNRTMVHRWGYLLSPKKHKERLRAGITYIFYLFFRAFSIIFGFVWVLTRSLVPFFGGWSFMVAWIIISILCRATATFITDYGIFRA